MIIICEIVIAVLFSREFNIKNKKKRFLFLHEEFVLPNNDEINDIFVRFVVVLLFVLIGRFSFVCRRCLAKRSLLVKKSV